MIIGFTCNWGAYSGAEMAGVLGNEYPPGMRLVRLACLGRLSLGMVLRAFERGADGVLLLGCPPEDCHYDSGAEKCREVFDQAQKMLKLLGIDPKRLQLVDIPVGDAQAFVKQVTAFTDYIGTVTQERAAAWKSGK